MITITDETTRLDLMDALASEGFGITEPDAALDSSSDAYRWRWLADEIILALSEDAARDVLLFIARMHDVDVETR